MSSKRRLHLGIDYGTSMSKIVFRDYGAPGGEAAVLVLRNGSFRIPSRLCATAAELLFGDDRKTSEECDIYESLKMRAAVEFSGDPSYYFGPDTKLPMGFTAADLSTLSVWFLISEGYKAIADYLDGRTEGINLGMTMGIPMAFFQNPGLRSLFLRIAQRAWLLYRGEGPVGSVLLIERAIRLLQKYPDTNIPTIPEYEIRDWVRSEGEAAMWWPFQSPAVRPGPYAKIDIGAGTTHASLYRIYGDTQTPKRGLAFFGAATVAVGMDAMDRAIAESQELGGDCLSLRGLEKSILDESGKARGATIPVREHIYEAYRKAWIETYRKINHYHAELDAWANHGVFVIGGGSELPILVQTVSVHPGRGSELQLAVLEQPSDLTKADGQRVGTNELRFVTVAYGLSNIGFSIPEALTPDQVPPMPDRDERRNRLDHEDIYAK